MLRRLAPAALAVLALLTLSGCSQQGQAVVASDDCVPVSADLTDQIAVGTEAGVRFEPSEAAAVRARKGVYVVAVRFRGEEKEPEVGVWTATALRGVAAPLLVADEASSAYTTWSTVEELPQFGVPLDSPLIAAARECLAAPVAAPSPSTGAMAPSASSVPRLDDRWVSTVAGRTGIGTRALSAYASADLRLGQEEPRCHLSWATLAGIGYVESHHGTIGGRVLGSDGRPGKAPIIGVALSGDGPVDRVADSDGGRLDGDTRYDRAVGPMQFIPATWRRWGGDGDGDSVVDPQDVDDAVYAAARYLCASGGPLDSPVAWRQAVLSYNRSTTYLLDVLAATNTYAARAAA